MESIDTEMDRLVALVQTSRVPLGTEKETQEGLEKLFQDAGFQVDREVEVAPGSFIDFRSDAGIGIEVKLKGSARAIHRQLERYAKSGELTGLILATNRAMGTPTSIEGLPIRVASLGTGWL